MKTQTTPPRWIVYYVGFLALLSLSTSIMGYVAPEMIFRGVEIPFAAAQPITFFYATRNVGILALCLVALFKQDSRLLFSVLLLRAVVELLDLIFTVQFGIGGFNPFIVIFVWLIVFLLPEFYGAYILYKNEFA